MKPAAFEYYRPETLDEALALLDQHGDDAKILAGGQSLVPAMNMRLAQPAVLIDINRLGAELDYIKVEDGQVRIGGLTRHYDVETSPIVKEHCPLLAEAAGWIGHLQIRYRGTIGGSIAHSDPSSELPSVVAALGGELVIRSVHGERIATPDEFFLTYMTTALAENEILAEIRFPVQPQGTGYAYEEFARRHGDFAIVGVAAAFNLEDGKIQNAKLGLSGVSDGPVKPEDVEEFLNGKEPSVELFDEAGQMVADSLDPDSDLHASAEYRKHLARVFVRRALAKCLERIQGGAK